MKLQWVSGSALMAVLMMSVAGCGTAAKVSSSTHVQYGGSAVIATSPDLGPNWFFPMNPLQADTDINLQVQALMFKPLLNITPQDGIDYHRSIVSNIASNKTGTRYVLTLNPKWRWSNGHEVTAQDVVFTWSVLKAASSSTAPWEIAGAGFGGIPSRWKTVTAQGTHTVVITLTEPTNQQWFIHNGLAQLSPVPKSVWDRYPSNMASELRFIESVANSPLNSVYDVVDGPFRISGFVPNSSWTFVKNSQYSGHKAYLNRVIFSYQTSSEQEFAALKTGQLNLGYLPDSLISSKSSLTHDTTNTVYPFGFNFIHPNLSPLAPDGIGPELNHLYVRQALQMGIGQPGIIKALYRGLGVPEDSPVPDQPRTVYFDRALQRNPYPFNISAGKHLLETHGWREVNGVMTKHGHALVFPVTYISSSTTLTAVAQLLKSDWGQEGIRVTLRPLPASTFFAEVTVKNPSAWAMALGGGWTYQPDFYPTGGGLFAKGAPVNKGGYVNSKMDQLIDASYAPGPTADTLKALDAYEAYAASQLPVLWMPWPGTMMVHSDTLHGTFRTYNAVSDLLPANYWWKSP